MHVAYGRTAALLAPFGCRYADQTDHAAPVAVVSWGYIQTKKNKSGFVFSCSSILGHVVH